MNIDYSLCVQDREYYFQKLKEVQSAFSQGISELITNHVNYTVNKYGNWKRYPRKIKKMLKKTSLWKLKDCGKINIDDVKVKMRY